VKAGGSVLAIDTSGGELLLALVDGDGAMLGGLAEAGGRHQERVIGAISELTGPDGLVALAAVAVARGPGSHTGLRVGLATAEGIAFARRLPIYPLSSLAVAAHRARLERGGVTALVNAGRGRVHVQRFDTDGGGLRPSAGPALAEIEAIAVPGMVAGEPQLMAAAAGAGLAVAPLVPGDEALVAVVRQAIGDGSAVAYHELRGEYGDLSMELAQ
jgi:tRNA threonylcarbamoyladenosine biosynthesis protein TsaB